MTKILSALLLLSCLYWSPAHASYCGGGSVNTDSMNEVSVANCVKLPGTFTVATLPPHTSVKPGTIAYTTDGGEYVNDPTSGWVAIGGTSSVTPSSTTTFTNKVMSCTPNSSGAAGTNTLTGLSAQCTVFDVTAYGAKCDASTDDTTAINATYAAALALYRGGNNRGVKIIFPAFKRCLVSAAISATGFVNTSNSVITDFQSSLLASSQTGGAIVDAMGSVGMAWENGGGFVLAGVPQTGIQYGRIAPTGMSGGGAGFSFKNFSMTGAFSLAACYNNNAEGVEANNRLCHNTNSSGGFGLMDDGACHFCNSITTTATQTQVTDTYESFNGDTDIQGHFYAASASGAPIWMENASQHRFIDSYGDNPASSSACVYIYATVVGGGLANYGVNRNVDFDLHCEGSIAEEFFITGPGSAGANFTATPLLKSIAYRDVWAVPSTSVFAIDAAANITSVTIDDLRLQITGGNASPSFTVFDTAASYTVDGEAYLYNSSIWNGVNSSKVILNQAGAQSFNASILSGPTSFTIAGSYAFATLSAGLEGTAAATVNDSSSSGTVATSWGINYFGAPTITATSATNYSGRVATIYCSGAPIAGTNVTIGTPVCIDSEGAVRFASTLAVNGAANLIGGATLGGGTVNINASSNNTTNIGTGSTTSNVNLGNAANKVVLSGPMQSTGGTAFSPAVTGTNCTSAAYVAGGTQAGKFTVTTGAASATCTVTITMTTVTDGYTCNVDDYTDKVHFVTAAGGSGSTCVVSGIQATNGTASYEFSAIGW